MSLIGYANQQNTAVWWISASYATDRSRSWSNRHGMYGDSASRDGLGRGFRSTMESPDISMGRNQWRSGDGPWHNFAKLNEARSMRCDIVAECAGITVAPWSQEKSYDRLACEYWWPGMWYAVEEYCNSCDVCQRYKVPQTGPKGLMTRRVVDRPWAVVAADMMEFPRSKNQNNWQRPAWPTTNGRRQKKSFPSASTGQRRWSKGQRTPIAGRGTSPERRRRAAVGGGDTGNAGAAGGGPSPVERMGRRGIRGGFSWLALKRKFCCWRRGRRRQTTLRRSGETTEESARVPTPPLAPVQEPSALAVASHPVQQVSYVGTAWSWCSSRSPVQQQRPATEEYPPSTGNNSASSPPGGLPRAATKSSATSTATATNQREEVRVEVRPLSPLVAGS
ncbi:unnamed protein product [Trichogramma brassicae]|uniref:Integrase zinc-binding domain-containing protein n=1 Tax=Trichogramma brassicae TaxID=86971 RepID=A0A6H5HXK2_9HYME|nr:unnamed protein product [Trichogramma brassicae]